MNSEDISKSDVLDILFEHRNKQYGAYALRKYYHLRMYKALGLVFALVAVFAAFSFMASGKEQLPDLMVEPCFTTVQAQLEKQPPEKPKEQPRQAAAKPQAQQAFVANLQVVRPSDMPDTIQTLNDTVAIGSFNLLRQPGEGPALVGNPPGSGGEGPGSGQSGPVPTPAPVFNPEEPVDNPDVEPQFPGGIQRLRAFLQRHLTNPRDMDEGERVRVVMKFVVGYNGKLQAFETVQDGGDEFNKEVVRVLKKMPDWVPGKSNGRNVSVYFSLPVIFEAAQ